MRPLGDNASLVQNIPGAAGGAMSAARDEPIPTQTACSMIVPAEEIMRLLPRSLAASLLCCCCVWLALASQALRAQGAQNQAPKGNATRTKVVLLGTGTPVPDPDRSGPATAIVVDNSSYLVDFGPGVVRRAKAAVLRRQIAAMEPANLKVAFVTHLHSDHTAGYSDLILTGWTAGRRTPLAVYGPTGLHSMTDHILQAYRIDIETRTAPGGDQRANPEGWKVNADEIKPGVIYKDEKVTVTAFPTQHAMESYGFRFDTPDRSIVISGDTSP